jgi:V/A-type H+-transporting ATPase subunit I
MVVKGIRKVTVFGNKSKREIFFEQLQKKEFAQVIVPEKTSYEKPVSEIALKKLETILEYLQKDLKESFMQKNGITYVDEKEFFETQKKKLESHYSFIDKLYNQISQVDSLTKLLNDKTTLLETYSHWKEFNLNPSLLEQSQYVKTFLGSIPTQNLKEIKSKNEDQLFDYEIISRSADYIYCLFLVEKSQVDSLMEFLKEKGFQEFQMDKDSDKSCQTIYNETKQEIQKIEENIVTLKQDILSHQKDIKELRLTYDVLSTQFSYDEANEGVVLTDFLFITHLWVAKEDLHFLENIVNELEEVDFEEAPITEEDDVPILIRNGKYAKPFEYITEMYSMPGKHDPDPTPYFSPFFPLFMGVCIGDAGPGLILMLLSIFCLKKLRLDKTMANLMQICFYGGFWSIVVGVLTGTYFAIPMKVPYLYEPSKDIMTALGISIALGYIHVLVAFCVKFLYLWRNGEKLAAFFDGMSKIWIMVGGLVFVLGKVFHNPLSADIGLYMFLIAVVVILFTSGRHEGETLLSKLMWGTYGVYELTGIFGDLLSYARLFALGLSAGIIANAINTITPSIISGIQFDSILHSISAIILICIFLVVLVFGHIFVMALGILSGFIHTMRLQFVEFFSKFFEGGSTPFETFRVKTKYFWIKKK